MWREPPVRTNGATPFSVVISYFAIAGSNPYTSRIERSLDGSMLSISILYESYVIRSIMASARVLSPPQICWYHSLSRNCEQKIVDDFLRLLCIGSKRVSGFSFRQFEEKPLVNDQYYWLGVLLQDS